MKLPPPIADVTRAPDVVAAHADARSTRRAFDAVPRPSPVSGTTASSNRLLELEPDAVHAPAVGRGRRRPEGDELRAVARADAAGRQARTTRSRKHERQVGAPSLRNAGLMLVHIAARGHARRTRSRVRRTSTTRPRASRPAAAPPPPSSSPRTLVRGFRIDIWDDTHEAVALAVPARARTTISTPAR